LPIAKNAGTGISNPILRQVVAQFDKAGYHQLFLDQALGASVGATLNDVTTEIATGEITPKQAAERVEEARAMR